MLRRLASAVARLLVDADQERIGVIWLQVLQGRRVLERVERYDAVVICSMSATEQEKKHQR